MCVFVFGVPSTAPDGYLIGKTTVLLRDNKPEHDFCVRASVGTLSVLFVFFCEAGVVEGVDELGCVPMYPRFRAAVARIKSRCST